MLSASRWISLSFMMRSWIWASCRSRCRRVSGLRAICSGGGDGSAGRYTAVPDASATISVSPIATCIRIPNTAFIPSNFSFEINCWCRSYCRHSQTHARNHRSNNRNAPNALPDPTYRRQGKGKREREREGQHLEEGQCV